MMPTMQVFEKAHLNDGTNEDRGGTVIVDLVVRRRRGGGCAGLAIPLTEELLVSVDFEGTLHKTP